MAIAILYLSEYHTTYFSEAILGHSEQQNCALALPTITPFPQQEKSLLCWACYINSCFSCSQRTLKKGQGLGRCCVHDSLLSCLQPLELRRCALNTVIVRTTDSTLSQNLVRYDTIRRLRQAISSVVASLLAFWTQSSCSHVSGATRVAEHCKQHMPSQGSPKEQVLSVR